MPKTGRRPVKKTAAGAMKSVLPRYLPAKSYAVVAPNGKAYIAVRSMESPFRYALYEDPGTSLVAHVLGRNLTYEQVMELIER